MKSTMTHDDFSNEPKTITELRAEKQHNGNLATPRDALIGMLRDLDSGKIAAETIYICYRESPKNGEYHKRGFRRGGVGGWQEDLALLEGARLDIWEWATH